MDASTPVAHKAAEMLCNSEVLPPMHVHGVIIRPVGHHSDVRFDRGSNAPAGWWHCRLMHAKIFKRPINTSSRPALVAPR